MSETPQGPGWWQASDDRWYPPHTHPAYQPQPFQPQPFQQRPPVKRGGVPKGLIVAGLVLVAVLVTGYTVTSYVFGRISDGLTGASNGECTLVGKQDVDTVLGGDFDLLQLGGLTAVATPVLDARVLADGTTCWATRNDTQPGQAGQLVRIARLESADAGQRFQQERTTAQGVKQEQGGGVTVQSQPYFNKDVSFGDEAFCTTTDMSGSSGMLVRRGNVLVYISLTSAVFNPQLDPSAIENGTIKFADDDAHCALAQQLAEKVG